MAAMFADAIVHLQQLPHLSLIEAQIIGPMQMVAPTIKD
jgi:hypothetical protein